jgi:hypothetical protein
MTKAELIALVKEYLETDEATFNANVDTFIRLMEEDVYRKVQLPKLRRNSVSEFVADTPYLETPTDYLAPYAMAVKKPDGHYEFLLEKDVNFIREAYPSPTQTSLPRFYALFDDDTFIIGPTPDQNYPVELHYFYKPESLVDQPDDGTTWLSTRAENAVLFGTILQGYVFLKGDQDVIAMYQKQYETALSDLVVIAEGRAKKDTYKEPNRRVPT